MTIPISVHTKRKADCDRRESLEGATPVLRHWLAMTYVILFRSKKQNDTERYPKVSR